MRVILQSGIRSKLLIINKIISHEVQQLAVESPKFPPFPLLKGDVWGTHKGVIEGLDPLSDQDAYLRQPMKKAGVILRLFSRLNEGLAHQLAANGSKGSDQSGSKQ